MSNSFNTFPLELKVHCKDCGLELKKDLLKFKGVHSVKIDQKLSKVVISGKVDPVEILSKFEKCGREAELWPCEQLRRNDPFNDPDIMAELEQLSDISGLHSVEVTKTTKITFQGQSTSNNPGVTQSEVLPHGAGGGGRLCSASSSCCGCHGGNTSFCSCCANNRNNYSYHNVPVTQSEVLPHGGGFCSASSSCCGGHGGDYTSSGSSCANSRNNYSYSCPRPQPRGYIPDPPVVPPRSGNRPIPSAPLMPPDHFHQSLPSPPAPSCTSFILKCLKG
ncbi:chitin-binding lectin 1-like [Lycium barbarum]|uniref:chitin-binding lectin 1-like n=1 Tax=Lycium barbarum TaxID=112863 RepID=UPI00293E21A1|nr:chitin-binding lectin 1-like [Lycium barbarum]XP_060212665.1 chitin-binding lectin 1-like [Lycium barbarum]XP_060212666.1 chitin-binding lectin 1-like [Lycium barbarum]